MDFFIFQWDEEEPNNFLDEKCGIMSRDGKWFDKHCSLQHNVICEKIIMGKPIKFLFFKLQDYFFHACPLVLMHDP